MRRAVFSSIPCQPKWLILTLLRKTHPFSPAILIFAPSARGTTVKRTQSWTSSMNISVCIPNVYLQGMETCKELPWHACAVLPGMSAGLLLRDISPACSLQQKSAVIKALVQSMHVCTRSCAAASGLCLMNEAWLKCTGTRPIQIACSEDASLSSSLLCLMLYKGLLVEIEWRLPLNFDLFSFHVQHCCLRMLVRFPSSFPST